jgi:predicted DNA-binding transcriptional regulator AlpA
VASAKRRSLSDLGKDELLRTAELARILKISASFLNKARSDGTGPRYVKIGKAVRYRAGDVSTWIIENSRNQVRSSYYIRPESSSEPDPQEIIEWLSP